MSDDKANIVDCVAEKYSPRYWLKDIPSLSHSTRIGIIILYEEKKG